MNQTLINRIQTIQNVLRLLFLMLCFQGSFQLTHWLVLAVGIYVYFQNEQTIAAARVNYDPQIQLYLNENCLYQGNLSTLSIDTIEIPVGRHIVRLCYQVEAMQGTLLSSDASISMRKRLLSVARMVESCLAIQCTDNKTLRFTIEKAEHLMLYGDVTKPTSTDMISRWIDIQLDKEDYIRKQAQYEKKDLLMGSLYALMFAIALLPLFPDFWMKMLCAGCLLLVMCAVWLHRRKRREQESREWFEKQRESNGRWMEETFCQNNRRT